MLYIFSIFFIGYLSPDLLYVYMFICLPRLEVIFMEADIPCCIHCCVLNYCESELRKYVCSKEIGPGIYQYGIQCISLINKPDCNSLWNEMTTRNSIMWQRLLRSLKSGCPSPGLSQPLNLSWDCSHCVLYFWPTKTSN